MPNWKTYESSVRLLSAIVAAHPGLKLNYDEVARFLGGGAKYKTVWDRMTQVNKHAKAITAAVNAGQDPSTVKIQDTGKPKAQAIAREYGDGVTENGSTPTKGTPRKRNTPAKSKKTTVEDAADDDDEPFDTPSKKKTPLNKTAAGRVTKTSPRKGARKNYADLDGGDSEEAEESDFAVKQEMNDEYAANGNGHHNGNGNGYGEAQDSGSNFDPTHEQDGAEVFYQAAEDYEEA